MHNDITVDEIKDGIERLADRLRDAMADDECSPIHIDNLVAAIRRLEAFLVAKNPSGAGASGRDAEIYRTADRLLGRVPG